MINYIILVLLILVCALSIFTVVTEPFVKRNTGMGRILRGIRIRLREKSRTSFCVSAMVLIIIGLVTGDDEKTKLLAALAIMLLTLIVLHPEDFLSLFRTRRKARKKSRLGFTPLLAGEVPMAKMAKELEPIEVEAEKGKDK